MSQRASRNPPASPHPYSHCCWDYGPCLLIVYALLWLPIALNFTYIISFNHHSSRVVAWSPCLLALSISYYSGECTEEPYFLLKAEFFMRTGIVSCSSSYFYRTLLSAWHIMCFPGYCWIINGFNDGLPYFCYGNILLWKQWTFSEGKCISWNCAKHKP